MLDKLYEQSMCLANCLVIRYD